VPSFVHFLNNYEIPERLKGGRFGMVEYHHPELLQVASELSETTQLLELIYGSEEMWGNVDGDYWSEFTKTTGELWVRLLCTADADLVKATWKTPANLGKTLHRLVEIEKELPEEQRRMTRSK